MADTRLDLRGSLSKARPRIFEGVVARTHAPGDALSYPSGDEHRDGDGLQRIVDQLTGLPVVTAAEGDRLGHPDNLLLFGVEHHEIGRVISGKVDGDKAVAQIYIHDQAALQEIEDGTRELSLGYRCVLDGEQYQRDITLDHLSVVPRARCGAVCALRTDSVIAPRCGCVASTVPDAKPAVMQVADLKVSISLDEQSKKLIADLAQLDAAKTPAPAIEPPIEKQDEVPKAPCTCNSHAMKHTTEESTMDAAEIQKQLDDATAKIGTLQSEITTLKTDATKAELALTQAQLDLKKATSEIESVKADAQTKVDAAKTEADAAKQARSDEDVKSFHAAIDARVELFEDAAKVGVEDYKAKTNREIKVAIVKKVDDMDIDATRSDEYVDGMHAGAMKRHTKAAESVADVRALIVENRDAIPEVADALKAEAVLREKIAAARKNRWR